MEKEELPKAIVCIGCGTDQIPVINAAYAQGYKVIGVDQTHGYGVVDTLIKVSTYDTRLVIEEIQKQLKIFRIKGVICRASAQAVITANELSKFLNLPSFGDDLTESTLSKLYLFEYVNSLGIKAIPTERVSLKSKNNIGYPAVVKPEIPLYGKKNVFLINNRNELKDAINASSEESINSKCIIQPYLFGIDLIAVASSKMGILNGLDFFIENNKFDTSGVKHNGMLEITEEIKKNTVTEIKKIIQTILNFNTTTGFTVFSFRYGSEIGLNLYEVNVGLSGDKLADIFLPEKWGKNFFEMEIQLMTNSNDIMWGNL